MALAADGVAGDVFLRRLLDVVREVGPDRRLPSERMLAERLEVSRPTIRDRLSLLEGVGALERRVGSGTYLRPLRAGDIAGIIQLGVLVGTLDGGPDVLRPVITAIEVQGAVMAARCPRPAFQRRWAYAARTLTSHTDDLVRADLQLRKALVDASGDRRPGCSMKPSPRSSRFPGSLTTTGRRSSPAAPSGRAPGTDESWLPSWRVTPPRPPGPSATTRTGLRRPTRGPPEARGSPSTNPRCRQKAQSSSSVFTALPMT